MKLTKCLAITILFLIVSVRSSFATDQIHDILIIGRDTICLKSFPLEDLGFTKRPFRYGNYDFPGTHCYRGYRATWKVIDKKLYLVEITKADDTQEPIDMVKYFAENNYTPVVIDGLIFADWCSLELSPFPRCYKYFGCVWKSKRSHKCKTSIGFEKGILKYNRYKGKR